MAVAMAMSSLAPGFSIYLLCRAVIGFVVGSQTIAAYVLMVLSPTVSETVIDLIFADGVCGLK